MAPFAAVVGALPWLARPFLENPITRRFAMPKPGDGTGTGKIMAVRCGESSYCIRVLFGR